MPFLAFVSGLALFQGDEEALRLWKALAYLGAAFALFGLVQEIAFPEELLFAPKKYYVGCLTGTFVNHNTAGTFLGIALAANVGLFLHDVRSIRLSSLTVKLIAFQLPLRRQGDKAIARAPVSLVVAVALFLTQSRGAIGATFISLTLMVAMFATRRLTADKTIVVPTKWRRAAALVAGVAIVIAAFALLGERSVYRMQEQGTEDSRWCAFASTLEAFQNNWLFGPGFGTFQDVFPMYRHYECAGIFGVWERAHNFYLEGPLGFGIVFAIAGFVGMAALLAILIRGVRLRHRQRFAPISGLAIFALAALHSLVDFSLQIPGFNVYFSAFTAAAVTVSLGRQPVGLEAL